MKYKRLGKMLVDIGAISEAQLNAALEGQKGSGKRLGTYLVDNHYITEDQLIEILRMQLGIDFIDLNKAQIDPTLTSLVPRDIARRYRVIPVRTERDTLYLAMEDPMNFMAVEAVKDTSHRRVVPMIAYARAIERALFVLYENEGANLAMAQMKEEQGIVTLEEQTNVIDSQDSNSAPTVKLVNSILERAISEKASDIHIEPHEKNMIVRIRVDGRLNEILEIPKELQNAVISRFKVMANMNIAERRIPQDGRAVLQRPNGINLDLRLNSMPTIYGEKIVIRLLTRDQKILNWQGIGITEKDHKKYERILANSSGMILIVGPTGSGKTSTLYTMINELNQPTTNMISLEDPVEFQIEGVTQVAINEKVGLTFASALRACLRQDPDIICVGEIRDGETAEIALRAAMTGHLVLSTIHTEDAISAIDRLKDLGIEPYLIASALRGVISQRLVRQICPNCRQEITPDPMLLDYVGMQNSAGMHFYQGRGCHQCFDSGYRGRTGVFEILTMNAKIRDLVASGVPSEELRKAISSSDFTPMIVNARQLVKEGKTTLNEVVRTIVTLE